MIKEPVADLGSRNVDQGTSQEAEIDVEAPGIAADSTYDGHEIVCASFGQGLFVPSVVDGR